ncbi:DNA topoisomerase, type IIA, domain A, partial [Dillenia turbinata]
MLLADLDQDTVDFVPNFDNSQKEPSLLPARIPALLLNGSSGIAVGMATNIPPHNLGELVDALSVLIHNPDATLQELLEYMPGPDFPTGGVIMGNIGILEAYRTGRGRVVVRGKTDVEVLDSKTKRTAIIIKEIPFQTNKAALVEKIAELVENKNLEGISDIRDESDRSGMRIVIELKRGADPSIILNNLYRLTALQSSFSCNMVGILNKQPKLMGLKELLQAFLDFRCAVVERRTKFKLSQAQERRHIVEGIIVGLDNMDKVIHIIRNASSNTMASADLRKEYGLSEKQAEALMDISLRKLSILELIEQEAIELKSKFSTPRRSMLEDTDSGQVDEIDVIPNEEILLALSEKGYVKRMKPHTFNLQKRGTIGKSVGKLRVNDTMSDFLVCHAHDHVLYFRGIVYSARAYKVPECSRTAAGTPLVQVPSDELKWVRCCTNDDLVAMASRNGMIRALGRNTRGSVAMRLRGEDKMASIDIIPAAMWKDLERMAEAKQIENLETTTDASQSQGVILMRLEYAGKIQSASLISATETEPDEVEAADELHLDRAAA